MCNGMTRTATYLLLAFLFCGCAPSQRQDSGDGLTVAKIRIDTTSKGLDGSVEMITRCSGFILSEKQVRAFLAHATRIKADEPNKYYRILPCSSTGTAVINKRKYNWVIRAGGIGEFYSDADRFIKVCGKNCCNKVPSIC